MHDKMMQTSFFLPKSMLKKIKKLSKKRHESMASSMRYLMEKGIDKTRIEDSVKNL